MATVKLTKTTVSNLPTGPAGIWTADSDLRGFFVVTYPTGAKIFFVRFTTFSGLRRVVRVGRFGELTVDEAREKARSLIAAATLGGDPAAERDKARAMPLFPMWCDEYLARAAKEKKTVREDRRYLALAAKKWTSRPLDSIDREDVLRLRQTMAETPVAANRFIASLRACFTAAIRSGLVKTNPAAFVRPFREGPPRARVISPDEMERLLRAVDEEDDVFVRAAIKLLILTGMRSMELLRAKWEDVDFTAKTWRIPSPKAGKPQVLPIDDRITEILKSIPRTHGNPHILPGARAGDFRRSLRRPWDRVKAAAGLADADLRLHDVRRSFGLEVARTAGLHVASKLLRHSSVKVTEQAYAPLGLDDLRSALEKRAEVLPFPEKKKGTG